MIVIEIIIIVSFIVFLFGTGVGIFFICVDGTEVGRAIDEKLARFIRGGEKDD